MCVLGNLPLSFSVFQVGGLLGFFLDDNDGGDPAAARRLRDSVAEEC